MRRHKALLAENTLELIATVGSNIDLARKRRRLSIDTVCSRAGITAQTYRRLANGEPGLSMGVLATVLHAMSLEDDLALIASPATDEVGISMERTHAPKRVREGDSSSELDTHF